MSYRQFIHFTSDAGSSQSFLFLFGGVTCNAAILILHPGGVEKILRFCQSVSQIGAAYAFTVDSAVAWMHLRRQFALGMLVSATSYAFEAARLSEGHEESQYEVQENMS
jgi:hypothetical protein